MSNKKNHGGSRKGSGRKKGSGLSSIIKSHVDEFMLNLAQEKAVKKQIKKDIRQISLNEGWIYIIQNEINGLVKVGITQQNNPKNRLSLYKSHNMNVKLLFLDYLDDCFDVEANCHAMFHSCKIKGDWFKLYEYQILELIYIINKSKYIKYF